MQINRIEPWRDAQHPVGLHQLAIVLDGLKIYVTLDRRLSPEEASHIEKNFLDRCQLTTKITGQGCIMFVPAERVASYIHRHNFVLDYGRLITDAVKLVVEAFR